MAQHGALPLVYLISSLPPRLDVTFPMITTAWMPPWGTAQPYPVSSQGPVVLLRALIRSWGCRRGVANFGPSLQLVSALYVWGESAPNPLCVDARLPGRSEEPSPSWSACSNIHCLEIREVQSEMCPLIS